jgi:hypothetical protein
VVDGLYVAAADRDRHPRGALGLFRRRQQMDRIGDQHVGVQPAALVKGLTLVTGNVSDFSSFGIGLFNPFELGSKPGMA